MDLEKLKKKLNDLKYLNDRSMVAEPSKYTVSDWLDFWLENYKKQSVKMEHMENMVKLIDLLKTLT